MKPLDYQQIGQLIGLGATCVLLAVLLVELMKSVSDYVRAWFSQFGDVEPPMSADEIEAHYFRGYGE